MRNIVLVVIEAVLLFAYVAYVHSGRSYWPKRRKAAAEDAGLDADVSEEKRNVDHLCQTGDFSGHTMVAQNVHKFYGDFHAVRGINVALRPAECFGLLGVNGAGKTTTFQMLAGFSELSDGEAYAENLKVTANPREVRSPSVATSTWQSRIGYCFQIDGLLDTLNAYEFLYLIGRLRGIADEDLRTIVDSLISLTDLTEYANRRCGSYSGGNKRKLSVAAALLGLPPLVFLDEPYAGVDVVARDKIFKGVDRVKKLSKSTIVLTSHSMEECEFSCDRLCIMVAGQMKCLGSLQHLRNKFGKGYRFEFMLKHGADNDPVKFVADVLELFPGIRVVETHENVCVFILDNKLPWSTIFTKVALLDENFALEHILIGENTLEQIFIAFAKQEEMKSTIVQSATNGELS
ncbi:phospholipid-transporting ATPase ABCA3-like [Haemaphysalis longicornis]